MNRISFRNSAFLREALIIGAFVFLTVLMTWPWAPRLSDAVPDSGDPYLVSWILWQSFHKVFTDPLNLFHGNIFFPYKYTLAFSENMFGLAVPMFPLFAIGVRPLTIQNIVALLGFTFSGYGAFRLARTLTGSTPAAWLSGIAFAFIPYRYQHISHTVYLFSGWIPLVCEAVVLYCRERSWKRALWLGTAFLMNGLSCIHWLVLTALPLAATGGYLAFRYRLLRDRRFYLRGISALGAASVLLLPFLIPYQKVAKMYGLVRGPEEAYHYSARLIHWFTAHPGHRLWVGLGLEPPPGELSLFPGLLLPLLALAAILLILPEAKSREEDEPSSSRTPGWLLVSLDTVAILAGIVAAFSRIPPGILIEFHGRTLFKASDPTRALAVLFAALLIRWWFAYPKTLTLFRHASLRESLLSSQRPESLVVALIWAVMGFLGSFGMNAPFHRILFEVIPIFRSIRAPVRWTMIADLGLALLAAMGAVALSSALFKRWKPRAVVAQAPVYVLALAILLENRVAPLDLMKGRVNADPVSLHLEKTPMRGGIAVLPVIQVDPESPYLSVLRAADHKKPLITGVSGFTLPIPNKLEALASQRPIPDDLLDHLESIPASFVIVREWKLGPVEQIVHHRFLARALKSGRLKFVKRFGTEEAEDLYVVSKTEPQVKSEEPLRWSTQGVIASDGRDMREDNNLTCSVEVPAESETVKGELLVRGWGRISGEDLEVQVFIDGERREPSAQKRTPRPDVAQVIPRLGDCSSAGYEFRYTPRLEDSGPHTLKVILTARDGRYRVYPEVKFNWEYVPQPVP